MHEFLRTNFTHINVVHLKKERRVTVSRSLSATAPQIFPNFYSHISAALFPLFRRCFCTVLRNRNMPLRRLCNFCNYLLSLHRKGFFNKRSRERMESGMLKMLQVICQITLNYDFLGQHYFFFLLYVEPLFNSILRMKHEQPTSQEDIALLTGEILCSSHIYAFMSLWHSSK